MAIYVLIILCLCTISSMIRIINSVINVDSNKFLAALISFICYGLAVIFQSLLL